MPEIKSADTGGRVGVLESGTPVVINATAAPYNADPTFTDDASEAIQDAIDAADAEGGGTVYLNPGSYKIASGLV